MRSHLSSLLLVFLWPLSGQASELAATEAAPPKTISVFIGNREPQSLPWTSTLTVWDVIKQAGANYTWGSPRKFRLNRAGEHTIWDIREIQRGEIPHPKLQPGDAIELPDREPKHGIKSEVQHE